MIKLKRIYEEPAESDGFRILVDRLWPRGISKEKAQLDLWLKEIAPSNELRIWYHHDPTKWSEFEKKYKEELKIKKDLIAELKELAKEHKSITLLYGAHDIKQNQAVVLRDILMK